MIYVNRNRLPIPDVFASKELGIAKQRLEQFYNRPANTRKQERYQKTFESELKSQFIISLRELFNEKCCYCESIISLAIAKSEYDHFRPKNGARGLDNEFSNEHYWWLTYEWNNLYYSCEVCNRYKSTWFPIEGKRIKTKTPYEIIIAQEKNLLIDPCIDMPEEHLIFSETGQVDFLSLKGKTTIEILKLNRKELVSARKTSLELLYGDWEMFLKLWRNKNKNRSKLKALVIKWDELFLSATQKQYAAIQRQMLSKWLNNHPEIQDYWSKKEYNLIEDTGIKEFVDTIEIVEETRKYDKETLELKDKLGIEDAANLELLRHVYIDKIEVQNFKCFDDLSINFNNDGIRSNSDTDYFSEPWLLFLGENGVGKSSILKAITIALCGENYFEKIELEASSLLQRNKKNGFIKLYLKGEEKPIEVNFDSKKITSSIKEPKANLIGYGSVRLPPKERKLSPERFRLGGIKAQNLFDYSVSLNNADKWLLDRKEDDFQRAALTLKDLMLLEHDVELKRNIKNGKVFIQNGNTSINIDELSDGYQSVYALAVDIMSSFVRDKITYDIAEGIVLIDEIGTHLHPRWKMEVVSQLRRTFPRMQFIVTTHEPLCLRGLKQGEVAVLTKDWDKKIYAITDLPDPATLRVDQILTSPFFGLHSAVDPQTEKIFEEYYSLLAKDKLTDEEENRKLDLSDMIPTIKYLGDSLREELAIYVIDELLAKNIRSETEPLNLVDLKREAKQRVKSIWDTLKNNEPENDFR